MWWNSKLIRIAVLLGLVQMPNSLQELQPGEHSGTKL